MALSVQFHVLFAPNYIKHFRRKFPPEKRNALDANRRFLEVFNLNFINQVQVIARHIVFAWHLIRCEFSALEHRRKVFVYFAHDAFANEWNLFFEKWPYLKFLLSPIVILGCVELAKKHFNTCSNVNTVSDHLRTITLPGLIIDDCISLAMRKTMEIFEIWNGAGLRDSFAFESNPMQDHLLSGLILLQFAFQISRQQKGCGEKATQCCSMYVNKWNLGNWNWVSLTSVCNRWYVSTWKAQSENFIGIIPFSISNFHLMSVLSRSVAL